MYRTQKVQGGKVNSSLQSWRAIDGIYALKPTHNKIVTNSGTDVTSSHFPIKAENKQDPSTVETVSLGANRHEEQKGTHLSFNEALLLFTREYAIIRGLSPGSIRGYEQMAISFTKVFSDKSICCLTIEDIYRWKVINEQKGISDVVIKGYLGKFRMLIKHVSKKHKTKLHYDDIVLPRIKNKLPVPIEIEEAQRIYRACPKIRDKLAIYLLFSTGVRIEELCTIKVKNIESDRIKILGKGGKERFVFLDDKCKLILASHMDSSPESPWLFPTHGRGADNGSISTFGMRVIVKKAAKRAGIERNITPHMFRHGFATNLLKNGCDIRYIQLLMGHEFITSTQLYTHVTNKELEKTYDNYHQQLDNAVSF